MIKVALVRGKYLNNFEGQNYIFKDEEIELVGISSLRPIHTNFEFPVIKLPSFADITGMGRAVKIISNRAFGDSQVLFGLGKYASQFDIFHTADPHYYYSYQLAKLRSENKIKKLNLHGNNLYLLFVLFQFFVFGNSPVLLKHILINYNS